MVIVGVNVMVPLVSALASMPPPSVKVLPPKVNELAPLLKVSLLSNRLVMLLFNDVPDDPAAPNTNESPLAGGVLPPDVVQLPAVFQFASVLPTQVSVPAAWTETVDSATKARAPNRFTTDFFMGVFMGLGLRG